MIHPDAEDAQDIDRQHEVRRAATITAFVGATHAILLVLSILLIRDAPGPGATDAQIIEYYSSSSSRVPLLVGLYVMPFAAIAFLWFVVALRSWSRHSVRREDLVLANLQLASGILYIAMFCAGAAASSVLAASIQFANGPIDPVVARQFPQYGFTLFMVFAIRMAAIFVFATSTIGRRSQILPQWFVYVGYATGLFLLLSVSFVDFLLFVFPAWLIVLSALLLARARGIPVDERG